MRESTIAQTDIVSPRVRSRMMKSVRTRDTLPERRVRALLWRAGVRFRVHDRKLPGTPDIANRRRKWVVFVHGCFWHGHSPCGRKPACEAPMLPRTNVEYWSTKISRNRDRDVRKCAQLRALGFRTLEVWECELKQASKLLDRLLTFVGQRRVTSSPAPRQAVSK